MSFLLDLYFFQGQKYTSFGKNILLRQSTSLGHSSTGHPVYSHRHRSPPPTLLHITGEGAASSVAELHWALLLCLIWSGNWKNGDKTCLASVMLFILLYCICCCFNVFNTPTTMLRTMYSINVWPLTSANEPLIMSVLSVYPIIITTEHSRARS